MKWIKDLKIGDIVRVQRGKTVMDSLVKITQIQTDVIYAGKYAYFKSDGKWVAAFGDLYPRITQYEKEKDG
jgi:hypothetical protein